MKQKRVLLTPAQVKLFERKFKEARILKEIKAEIENHYKKYKKN